MGYLKVGRPRDLRRATPNGKAVVLRCDQDIPGLEVLDRVITTPMAVRHLRCRRAESQRENLVAEADAEDWDASPGDRANGGRSVFNGSRIARAVRQKNPVRLHGEDLIGPSR